MAALLLAFAFQGSRGLWEPDEGRYFDVAFEMLRSDDWIHPALHHEIPHYTKPPVTYWAIAASVGLLGRNEWAVRLPNSIAYLATLIVIFAIGRTLEQRNPWLPVLIYATSLVPFVILSAVSTDTILTFLESLAMLGFVRGW